MTDKEGVRIVFAGLFKELVETRNPQEGDELRLCWRDAAEATCQQFAEWGGEISRQRVYRLVDDFLHKLQAMAVLDDEVDWSKEGF